MLSDEEKEIFNNLKDYMQSNIDNGYHKFIYNDLGWDFKCIDCINAIDKVLKQSKEIEELKKDKLELINKNHVVHLKDVEKELREMKKVIDTKNAEIECLNIIHESYKEMVKENNYISKDKIKAKIEELKEDIKYSANPLSIDNSKFGIIVLQSLLEKE